MCTLTGCVLIQYVLIKYTLTDSVLIKCVLKFEEVCIQEREQYENHFNDRQAIWFRRP